MFLPALSSYLCPNYYHIILSHSDQMAEWAASYDLSQVQFITVCVDSAGVALQFDRWFGLTNAGVINCHIPSRGYMPVG